MEQRCLTGRRLWLAGMAGTIALAAFSGYALADSPSPAGPGTAGVGTEKEKTPPEALIKNRFEHDLKNDKIKVEVLPIFGNHFSVAVSGELDSQEEVDKAKKAARGAFEQINKDQPGTVLPTDYSDKGLKVVANKDQRQKTADALAKSIAAFIGDDRVIVHVRPRPNPAAPNAPQPNPAKTNGVVIQNQIDLYTAYLSGAVATEKKKDEVISTVERAIKEINEKAGREAVDAVKKSAASNTAPASSPQSTGAAGKKKPAPSKGGKKPAMPGKKEPLVAKFSSVLLDKTATELELRIDPRDEIKKRYEARLADPRLTVRVQRLPRPNNTYVVSIVGAVDSKQQIDGVRAMAADAEGDLRRLGISGIAVSLDTRFLTGPDPDMRDYWPISYLGGTGTADLYKTAVIDSLVDALNAMYGGKDAPVVTRDGNNLHLHGKQSTVLKIKTTLALLDTSQPQVQMDFWAIQVSGTQQQVFERASKIREKIDATRKHLIAVVPMLRHALRAGAAADTEIDAFRGLRYYEDQTDADAKAYGAAFPTDLTKELGEEASALQLVYKPMFPADFARFLRSKDGQGRSDAPLPFDQSFTLDQTLVLLGVSRYRGNLFYWFQRQWMDSPLWLSSGKRSQEVLAEKKRLQQRLKQAGKNKNARYAVIREMLHLDEPFPNLRHIYNPLGIESDLNGVRNLMQDIKQYTALIRALGLEGEPEGAYVEDPGSGREQYLDPYSVLLAANRAPEGVQQHSAAVDTLLKHVIEAFQADLQEMYLKPLVQDIRATAPLTARSGGVSLIGTTRMVVTSRQQASLQPSLISSVENTRPKPFGSDLLNLVAPAGSGGAKTTRTTKTDADGNTTTTTETNESEDTTGLSGASKLLAGLPPAKAALLTGALLNDIQPAFGIVAPGIAITIKPAMTPDGGSADLTLDTSFGVKTTGLGADNANNDVWAQAEPDAVQSHHVTTQTYVSGFDLFDISSFHVETATPQGPDRIPILSRIPLFGPMFQFPRGSRRVHHESIILVNVSLLPRALGMIGFYGAARNSVLGAPKSEPESPQFLTTPGYPAVPTQAAGTYTFK